MSRRWTVAFSFLILTIHEAHELVHALVARAICGAWPVRDFNAWHLVGGCTSRWPTAAGPLFSYAVMLLGALIAARSSSVWRSIGIATIFAANPFARIFTAVMGGGDEMVVGRNRIAVVLFVVAICGAALVAAWRFMKGVPHRVAWFVFGTLWPMVLTGVALFVIGNRALRAGVLAEPTIAGAPLLVMLVSGLAAVMAIVTVRQAITRR